MMAAWMAAATVFAFFLGIAATASERTLRILQRQGRVVWIVALALSVVWPAGAVVMASLPALPRDTGAISVVPVVQSAMDVVVRTLPPIPDRWLSRLDPILAAGWMTVSIVMLVRLLLAMRALAKVERRAIPGSIAGVSVLVTTGLGPAVFGIRRMRFLMPQWLLDLDEPLRELVMRHEQEHLRARDPQLALGVAVALALVPWNPGVWWIARRLRLAIELDCDARVLRASADRERYARLLILIAQRQARNAIATMLVARTSDLTRRISGMNASRPAFTGLRIAVLALVAVIAVACSGKVGTDLATSPVGGAVATTEATYYAPEGAKPAVLVEHPSPVYPATLRSTGVQGEVLAMFVVDSSGRVLDGSLKIVRSTDSLFTEAVRSTVAGMRFDPPELNGKKIRQLVQQAFIFDPRGADPPTVTAKPTTDPTNRNPMPLRSIVISRQ